MSRTRRPTLAVLALALSAYPIGNALAQGLTPYVESSGTELKLRSNAGLTMQTDRLHMRADLALRGQQVATPSFGLTSLGGKTEVVPNLRSSLTIAKNLDIETRVNFTEWNARSATTFDTRVRYKKALDTFFDELDGSLWRSPDGWTKQSLRLGFKQALGDFGDASPLMLTGHATFETTQNAAAAGSSSGGRKVGIETKLAGFTPAFLTAEHALIFKVERTSGAQPSGASTVTYDQSWTTSPMSKLALQLQLLRQSYTPAGDFEPSMGLSWRSQF